MAQFYSIDDLANLPEPKWLIQGLFEQDSLVMLVGPPGSFKSFLAIDWALCLAAGLPWNGRLIKPCRVLYALGEGKASLLKRIRAWTCHKRLTLEQERQLKSNFRVTFDVPQLAVPRDAARFMEELDIDEFNPSCLMIDTLARSYVGKNENDPMDAGVWIENVDRLRKRGMTVLVLHHTAKNTEQGLRYRGTTAWLGAMDTSFVLERNPEGFKGLARLSCGKQKDHQEPEDVWMQSMQIRPDAHTEGSIVLIETNMPGEEEAEQKAADDAALDELIINLLGDESYPSDRARAKALADQTHMLHATAQSRIFRARRLHAKTEG